MIHGTAHVHYTATVGKGTDIWAYSQVGPGSTIGENCVIGRNVEIGPNVVIGDNCKIQSNSLIYEGVTIGNREFVWPNTVTTNDIDPQALGSWSQRFRETIIEDDVAIGAGCVIICGITLGRGCRIGAGSVVTKSIDPWWRAYGNPARQQSQLPEQSNKEADNGH